MFKIVPLRQLFENIPDKVGDSPVAINVQKVISDHLSILAF